MAKWILDHQLLDSVNTYEGECLLWKSPTEAGLQASCPIANPFFLPTELDSVCVWGSLGLPESRAFPYPGAESLVKASYDFSFAYCSWAGGAVLRPKT